MCLVAILIPASQSGKKPTTTAPGLQAATRAHNLLTYSQQGGIELTPRVSGVQDWRWRWRTTAWGQLLRRLVDGAQAAREQVVLWMDRDGDGRRLPSGVYFARLSTADRSGSIKLVLTK